MKILELQKIKTLLPAINLIPLLEQAFIDYSSGKAVVPPVGELLFQKPPGDVHIKYGYIMGDDYYVIKIASGFYENKKLNLPSSNGLMLVFNQKTGGLEGVLLDQGYLTDIRTAVAGAIAAKYFAPSHVTKIGVVGAGTQARLQLEYLKKIVDCKEVMVLSRDIDRAVQFQNDMQKHAFNVEIAKNAAALAAQCNLIVTTTPATEALLFADQIQKGTHITAVGADTPHKQELDTKIFNLADILVVDSLSQCLERGESSHAYQKGLIRKDQLIELGMAISQKKKRSNDHEISIVDLTGVAVQDIAIAKAVFEAAS